MKRIKTEELAKLSDADLVRRLNDLRTELSTLRSKAARGTLKKELGEIKTVRRNIARVMTVITAERTKKLVNTGTPKTHPSAKGSEESES